MKLLKRNNGKVTVILKFAVDVFITMDNNNITLHELFKLFYQIRQWFHKILKVILNEHFEK